MDLGKEFVASIVRGGEQAYALAVERGISAEILSGDGRAAWEYLVNHRKEYGNIPSSGIIFGKTLIDLDVAGDQDHNFWIAEVLKHRLFVTIQNGTTDVTNKLKTLDPVAAAEAWEEIHRKIKNESLSFSKVESLISLRKQVIEQYENAKMGVKGIPTPWPTMTEQTMGWWPEDLVLFVGRLSVGKTWALIITAHCAWRAGKKVLFVSTEMNKVRMAMRFFALHFRLNYEDLRKGRLGEFVEDQFRKNIGALLDNQDLMIVGGDFDFSMPNVESSIEKSECDLVAVDGTYLIKNRGKDRHEIVSNTFDDLKRIGKKLKIVVVANSQFNRSAKKGEESTIAAENIGITDVAGWNMDVGFGLHQTDDMRDNCQMGCKAIKIREGRPKDFISRWDLDRMDFSEIGEDGTDVPDDNKMPPSTNNGPGGKLIIGKFTDRDPGSDDGDGDEGSSGDYDPDDPNSNPPF